MSWAKNYLILQPLLSILFRVNNTFGICYSIVLFSAGLSMMVCGTSFSDITWVAFRSVFWSLSTSECERRGWTYWGRRWDGASGLKPAWQLLPVFCSWSLWYREIGSRSSSASIPIAAWEPLSGWSLQLYWLWQSHYSLWQAMSGAELGLPFPNSSKVLGLLATLEAYGEEPSAWCCP